MDKQITLLESVEKYLNNQMSQEEKMEFEKLRTSSPDVDMLVVEHRFFLSKLSAFGEKRNFKHKIQNIHNELIVEGKIHEPIVEPQPKLFALYNKYKKTAGIAAAIACVTALFISGLVTFISPNKSNEVKIQQLSRDIAQIKRTQNYQNEKLKEVDSKIPEGAVLAGGGSAFMIDNKGYLITNAHVLKGTGAIVVDNEGKEFNTIIVHVDHSKDLAILKIKDRDFKNDISYLPYSLKRKSPDLGEEVFTMGYPRNEVTYNSGYISAKTGYDGDTATFQLSLLANPGNSGGPVFNKKGEVIGVLSTRQAKAEGVVFAIKSEEIFQTLKDWKKSDTVANTLNIPIVYQNNTLSENRVELLKKLDNYIFMVKAYN